jgi:cell division septation protein DedD
LIDEPVPAEQGSAAASAACISVGPFRDAAAAEQAVATLVAAGHSLAQRTAEEDFWIGYWVYLEELASESAAREVAAQMREGGIADAYVVSDEELGTLVSLGVFSEARRADRQRERTRSLGREPGIVERTRRAAASWLDLAVTADAPAIDWQTLQPAESSTALRREACPDHPPP